MNLCGIDEAGRGSIAGPLSVAGCILKKDIKDLNDSKKLTVKKREYLYEIIKENSYYHIVLTSSKTIDKLGLSLCMKNSILEIMQKLNTNNYLIDGNTSFKISNLEHQIKADQKIKEVSAASILAKVTRDNYMCDLSSLYLKYNFKNHKGYGTKEHIELIKKYGYSDIHRLSFNIKSLN